MSNGKNFVHEIEERSSAFHYKDRPSGRIFAITLSSNHARDKTAYKAYRKLINNLPTSTFMYTKSKSDHGKYHVHGIINFKYRFNYKTLMDSRKTKDDFRYDIHIQYDEIKSKSQFNSVYYYITHQVNSTNHLHITSPDSTKLRVNRKIQTCIPEVQTATYVKSVTISGL